MRLAALLVLIPVLVLVVSACGSGLPAPPPGYLRIGHVADGDTVVLQDGSTVRLVQIDTPEVFFHEECFGEQASAETKRLLPKNTLVRLVRDPTTDSTDQYGRLLRYVIRSDGLDINVFTRCRRLRRCPYFFEGERGNKAAELERLALTAGARAAGPLGRLPLNAVRPGARGRYRAAAVVQPTSDASRSMPSSICASSTRLNDRRTLLPPRPSGKNSEPGTMPTPRSAARLARSVASPPSGSVSHEKKPPCGRVHRASAGMKRSSAASIRSHLRR